MSADGSSDLIDNNLIVVPSSPSTFNAEEFGVVFTACMIIVIIIVLSCFCGKKVVKP